MSKRKTAVKYRDISWGEVFYEILIKWRILILMLLVGAIAGACGGYVYDKSTYAKKLAKYEKYMDESDSTDENQVMAEELNAKTVLELYNTMSPAAVNDVYVAVDVAKTFDKLYASKIRQFDNTKSCYEISFRIKADSSSDLNDIATYIVKQINEGYWINFFENEKYNTKDIQESFYAFKGYNDKNLSGDTGFITVYMWFNTPDVKTDVTYNMCLFVSSLSDFFNNSGIANTVRLANDNKSFGAYDYFMELKNDYDVRCRDALSTLSFYRLMFNLNQQVLYNKLTYVWSFDLVNYVEPKLNADGTLIEVEEKVVKSTVSKPKEPSIRPIYLVGGAVGLPLVFSVLVFFVYLFSSKLHLSDDTVELFGQYTYGRVSVATTKKFGSKIDKAISNIRLGVKKSFDKEKAIEMIEAGIRLSLADCGGEKSVTFIGCDMSDEVKAVLDNISQDLKRDDITVKIVNDALYNPSALLDIRNSKNIILAETCNKTTYNEIIDEIDLIDHEMINKLGMVVFE